jgi:hypothetical protein
LVVQVLASYRRHLVGFTHVNLVRRVAEPQLLLVRQLRTLKHRTLVVNDARGTVHLQVLVLKSRVLLTEYVFKGTPTDLRQRVAPTENIRLLLILVQMLPQNVAQLITEYYKLLHLVFRNIIFFLSFLND